MEPVEMEQNGKAELARLTRILLDETHPRYSLRPEVMDILALFDAMSQHYARTDDIAEGETRTAQGLAISPTMAAMCAEDYTRTITYLRGLNAAISDLKAAHPERRLRALYVGTGPYAILALPLMTIWSADDVQFDLIDIHAASLDNVRTLLEGLDLTDHVAACHGCDAMIYEPDPLHMPDIVIAEIMLAGLENEPQVAVTRALYNKIPDAIFLPESIDIAIIAGEDDAVPQPIFSFDEAMWTYDPAAQDKLPAAEIVIPDSDRLYYETRVQIYGPHVLEPFDSGLTTRRVLGFDCKRGETVQLAYQMGERPGFIRADTSP